MAAVWQINCSGEARAGKAPLCKSNKAGTRAVGYNEKDEPSNNVKFCSNKNKKFLFAQFFYFVKICEVT